MSEIFLVEDSDMDTLVFDKVLELSPLESQIQHFTTASGCINELKKRMTSSSSLPELIVLDIYLEDERGEMVLDFIDQELPHKIPVIILSASMGLVNEDNYRKNACIKHLSSKPLTTDKLDTWISSKLIA